MHPRDGTDRLRALNATLTAHMAVNVARNSASSQRPRANAGLTTGSDPNVTLPCLGRLASALSSGVGVALRVVRALRGNGGASLAGAPSVPLGGPYGATGWDGRSSLSLAVGSNRPGDEVHTSREVRHAGA